MRISDTIEAVKKKQTVSTTQRSYAAFGIHNIVSQAISQTKKQKQQAIRDSALLL